MKLSFVLLIAAAVTLGSASAGRPHLAISVRDGTYAGLETLDPSVSWENSNRLAGDVDLSYGFSSSLRATTDVSSLPRKVWGQAQTQVSGWGVRARAEYDAQERTTGIQLGATHANADLELQLTADNNAGTSSSLVKTLRATKGFDSSLGHVTVTPQYDWTEHDGNVAIELDADKTRVRLTASTKEQEVSLSQQVSDNDRVSPTINSKGDVSVAWERTLSEDSTLTATIKPNDNVNVEWRDAAWTANVNMPIEGRSLGNANVSIKRDVSF